MNNTSWDNVLTNLDIRNGEVRTIGKDFYKNVDGRFDEILNSWNQAGYTPNKVEWINFYPEKHFDKNVSEEFAKQVNLTHIRSWISCIRPGKSAPWHQDIDDNMDQYMKLGNIKRYTCHIGTPAVGQVLLIEKESFYMVPQGTVTEWPHYMAWHGASNCGFENQYLYHFLGYEV